MAALSKKELRQKRHDEREKLTNWYMINMTWGFTGIIVLHFIQRAYNGVGKGTLTQFWGQSFRHMDLVMWILAGIALLGAGYLFFVISRKKDMGASRLQRRKNYVIFLIALSAVSLYLTFYNMIRVALINIFPPLQGLSNPMLWREWSVMLYILIYLIVMFVVYIIKYKKIK